MPSNSSSFLIQCPVGVNPEPLIELSIQSKYKLIPSYEYMRADNQTVQVVICEKKIVAKLSHREKKGLCIVVLAFVLLISQRAIQVKHQTYQVDHERIKNRLYMAKTTIRSIKMVKALHQVLSNPIYIRKVELTPTDWYLDVMGTSDQMAAFAKSWGRPLSTTQESAEFVVIKGGAKW